MSCLGMEMASKKLSNLDVILEGLPNKDLVKVEKTKKWLNNLRICWGFIDLSFDN